MNNTIQNINSVVNYVREKKHICIALMIVLLFIVKYNTEVHPYLLADNRHYTFYIWNRFYGRFNWFRYIMCPVYLVSILIINNGVDHLHISLRIFSLFTLIIYLCFQRLLEIRYFLVPFLLFRLHAKPKMTIQNFKYVELVLYIVINIFTFYTFINKKIYWPEYPDPQHIIW